MSRPLMPSWNLFKNLSDWYELLERKIVAKKEKNPRLDALSIINEINQNMILMNSIFPSIFVFLSIDSLILDKKKLIDNKIL